MKRTSLRARKALALGVCIPLTITIATGSAGAAAAAGSPAQAGQTQARTTASHGHRLIPRQVYVPYFETWTKDSIPAVARSSGSRYLTLAFLQTPKPGSCSVAWNGKASQTVKPGGRYVAQIARLRAMGGDVVPSFGGFSADQGG